MKIKVLVADDQELLRSAVSMIVQSQDDMEMVGQAVNGLEAVQFSATLGPDVVVMDVRMPVLDGVEATRRIVAAGPNPKILMLTTFDLDEHAFGALQAGASGFLLKDAPGETIVGRHPQSVAAGDAVISPSTTRRLLDHVAVDWRPHPPMTMRWHRSPNGSGRSSGSSPPAHRIPRSPSDCSCRRRR